MVKLHCDKCDKVIDDKPKAEIITFDSHNVAMKKYIYCKDCLLNLDLKKISSDVKSIVINTDF